MLRCGVTPTGQSMTYFFGYLMPTGLTKEALPRVSTEDTKDFDLPLPKAKAER